MKRHEVYADLDRMLDDLNANREPADLTGDLADLVEMARGLKELGHTTWPDSSFPRRTAIQLSQELNPQAMPVSLASRIDDTDPDATGELPPLPLAERARPAPTSLRRGRTSNLRKSLEIAAAAVVLVLFTALIATLLSNNGATPEPTASAAFGAAPAASTTQSQSTTPQTTAPAVTEQFSTAAAPSPDASLPASVSDPVLQALQVDAGFDLRAPATALQGLTMLPPAQPMTMGNFTNVALKYQDANGQDALTITEASPYKDSAQTMPADIFNSAVPTDLGNGQTVSVYQSDTDIQIWWEVGPTSIRLESGGPAGTTLLSKELMLDIARSMVPVDHATAVSSMSGMNQDAAIDRARQLLGMLGGNANAGTGSVQLTTIAAQTALGMPQLAGMDAAISVWSITFPHGMSPAGCPDLGVSVCNGGAITVIVDAQTGTILAWRDPSGTWKTDSPTNVPPNQP
jgi:hypothetical protein